jgi:hypothetical protein
LGGSGNRGPAGVRGQGAAAGRGLGDICARAGAQLARAVCGVCDGSSCEAVIQECLVCRMGPPMHGSEIDFEKPCRTLVGLCASTQLPRY